MFALLSHGVTVLHSVEAMLGGKIGAVQMRAGTMVTGPHKQLERRLEMGHHQPRHALHKSTPQPSTLTRCPESQSKPVKPRTDSE
jgi:hypothetical protein